MRFPLQGVVISETLTFPSTIALQRKLQAAGRFPPIVRLDHPLSSLHFGFTDSKV